MKVEIKKFTSYHESGFLMDVWAVFVDGKLTREFYSEERVKAFIRGLKGEDNENT